MHAPSSVRDFTTKWQFVVLLFVLAISWPPQVAAQDSNPRQFPRYEIFGGYLASGQAGGYNDLQFGNGVTLESSFSSTHGVGASFLHNFNRVLGLKADFSLQPHSESFRAGVCTQLPCSPVIQNAGVNPRLLNFLAGPEIKLRNHTRFTPYIHGLAGIAHASASFTTSGSAANLSLNSSETGFATAVGGGSDIRFSNRLSFRTGMDFNPAWVGRDDTGARTIIKNVRLWGGLLFH